MISLEDNMLPKLRSCLCNKHNSITSRKLNSYHLCSHTKIKKTNYQFLDVFSTRTSNNEVELSTNRIAINSNIYNNWCSHAPSHWKIGTLNLIKWAKFICASEHLTNEVNYINDIFTRYNHFPFKVVSNTRIFARNIRN